MLNSVFVCLFYFILVKESVYVHTETTNTHTHMYIGLPPTPNPTLCARTHDYDTTGDLGDKV